MQRCRRCAVLDYSSAAKNYCIEIVHVHIPSESRGQISSHFGAKSNGTTLYGSHLVWHFSPIVDHKTIIFHPLLCFNDIRHRASPIPDFCDKQQVHSVRPLASIPLVYWHHKTCIYLSPVDTHNISIFFQLLIIILINFEVYRSEQNS